MKIINSIDNIKTAFIHGRPAPHAAHAEYARLVNAEFIVEDRYLRWHDKPNASKLRRYLSWVINAVFFPNKKNYDIFYTEGIRMPVFFLRKLGLISKKQQIVALMADETVYFLYSSYYSKLAKLSAKLFLNSCDSIVVVGKMQEQLLNEMMDKNIINRIPIYTIFNSASNSRMELLKKVSPNLNSNKIVCIANGPAGFRVFYKGLDLLLEAFDKALQHNQNIELSIVGQWEKETINTLLKPYSNNTVSKIKFVGNVDNLSEALADAALYLHPARGEAWGISINEAMIAGVPCIVSQYTGAKEMVELVSNQLVVPLNTDIISEKINWYFSLPLSMRTELSVKSKHVSSLYTEQSSSSHYETIFNNLIRNLFSFKTVFIHGRPSPHPIHTKIAKTISARFYFVDRFFRWHDSNKPAFYRYFSWVFNALFFPNKKFDIILAEGCHITPVIAKELHLISRKQKLGALMANEVLYFLDSKKYNSRTAYFNLRALKSYDFLMCIGEQQTKLAKKILGNEFPIIQIFNGVPSEKFKLLSSINPNINSKKILFIGNGPDGWRTWYKGLDLMIKSFEVAKNSVADLEFIIVGDWTKEEQTLLLQNTKHRDSIQFVGLVNNIETYFAEALVYLHTARGDSFPTTVLESMTAGLIPIISTEMGTVEIVEKLDKNLIVELDENLIAKKIEEIICLPDTDKKRLSEKSKELISKNYREERALSDMKSKLYDYLNNA